MPLYPVQKAIGGQQALLDEYLPNAERNIFGGKVTLRDMLDFVRGKTAEEQVAGFAGPAINPALPMAVGMYVKPRWGETGSFSALWDKKPRVEISDELMKLKQPLERKVYQAVPLGEIIEHPELFKRYPEMRDWKTTIDYTRESAKPWSEGSFNAQYIGLPNSSRGVYEVTGSSEPNIMKSLLHEIQHGVQHQSEFAKGGSPSGLGSVPIAIQKINSEMDILDNEIKILSKRLDENPTYFKKAIEDRQKRIRYLMDALNNPQSHQSLYELKGMEAYKSLAGEIEARDTANRMLMNLEQRRKRLPYAGQGIPLEEMTVR